MTVAMITGRSRFCSESYVSLPTPVQAEDDLGEQRAAADERAEVEAEEAETNAISDVRSACRKSTRRSVSPFARAVRT